MKKYICFLILNFYCTLFAQISIGNNSVHQSAILELNTSNITPKKGFLPTRGQLLNNRDRTTIPNPVIGMTTFNKLTSGINLNTIDANSFVVWDGYIWQKISSLDEIKSLKFPKDFAIATNAIQNFTTTNQLATINLSQPVELKWENSEIQVNNPSDIELSSNSFNFLKESYFQLSGMVTVKVNTVSKSSPSQVILALQKSTNGTVWTNIFSNTLPFEQYATNNSQTITIPNFIHHFTVGERIRLVLYKPTSATNYSDNSGITGNASIDVVKSFRILRIEQ